MKLYLYIYIHMTIIYYIILGFRGLIYEEHNVSAIFNSAGFGRV